jgi:hypothetical protein
MTARAEKELADASAEIDRVCGGFPVIHRDPGPGDLERSVQRRLLRDWRGWAADRNAVSGLPHRRLIDPVRLGYALGSLMVVEPADGGCDFVYRLAGTDLVSIYGKELTGRHVSNGFADVSAAFYLATYRLSAALRRPVFTRHPPPSHVPVDSWSRLVLPFADDCGNVVRFLSCVLPGDRRSVNQP